MRTIRVILTSAHMRATFAPKTLLSKGAFCILLLASLFISACVPSINAQLDQDNDALCSSPKMLLHALHSALQREDYEALAFCMAPGHRDEFAEVLTESKAYTDKVTSLVAAIQTHIGPREAAICREQAFMGMLTSPLGGCGRKDCIDWEHVLVRTEADTARVLVDDPKGRDFSLVRSGERWFLSPSYFLEGVPEEGTAWYARFFGEYGCQADMLRRQILQGKIHRGNFTKAVLSQD